jgi:hypothetical protein
MAVRRVSRALIVGINKYQDPANNLRGCVNDALMMAKIATDHAGFPHDQVRLLCDQRATTAAIRSRLKWLVKDAAPGSSLLFHYSGHGSQVRDRNGDELDDHLDEIICPHDLNWDDPITDDEFAALIATVPADVRLTIVLDCCHSGTATREFFKERPKAGEPMRLRYLTPPPDVAWRAAAGVEVDTASPERTVNMKAKRVGVQRFGLALTDQNVVLVAGCKSTQTSADAFIDHDYHGALTYGLYQALEGAKYQATNRQLVQKAAAWLSSNHYEQVPQLETRAALADLPFLAAAAAV